MGSLMMLPSAVSWELGSPQGLLYSGVWYLGSDDPNIWGLTQLGTSLNVYMVSSMAASW